jgi:hypothetical protein
MFSKLLHVEIDIGYAIMASFNGAGPKRDLFERVLSLIQMPTEMRAHFQDACKEFGRLIGQRNKIVHGEWHLMADGRKFRVGGTKNLRYFDNFIQSGKDPQNAVFTVEKIVEFRNECEKLNKKFSELAQDEEVSKLFPYV